MKKNNTLFIVIAVAVTIALFIALAVINSKQVNQSSKGVPTTQELETSVKKAENNVKDAELDYENKPFLGKKTAPVKIAMFGDYKCPACKQFDEQILPEIEKTFIKDGTAKFYFMNFPFLGNDSSLIAVAGKIIYDQNPDSYWKFHEYIYKNQKNESVIWGNQKYLNKVVKEELSEIDSKKFEKELQNYNKYLPRVMEEQIIGNKLGVSGTPTIFVDGKKVEGNTYEEIGNLVAESLKEKTEKAIKNISDGEKNE